MVSTNFANYFCLHVTSRVPIGRTKQTIFCSFLENEIHCIHWISTYDKSALPYRKSPEFQISFNDCKTTTALFMFYSIFQSNGIRDQTGKKKKRKGRLSGPVIKQVIIDFLQSNCYGFNWYFRFKQNSTADHNERLRACVVAVLGGD